ncbi:MAG: adenylate/guanylate cyclase [Caulobacteraceae bacterium]|nr:adenylate/guanylate cyclase [Caulobacteraceae bacterium]
MAASLSSVLERPISALAEPGVRARLALRRVGVPRLAVTIVFVVLGTVAAAFSWQLPLFGAAERALYDLRVVLTAPAVDQDHRVVMVVFNDDTLMHTQRRSPLDRGLLAKALTQIDALGPKAIGIDILIDEPQPDDEQLVAALRGMKTPTHLAFASNATNTDEIQTWQEAFLRKFQAGLAGSRSTPASIRVEKEDDVVRRWPSHARGEPPLLAVSMAPHNPAFDGYRGSLRFRSPKFVNRPLYAEFPIDLFSQPFTASLFKRFVAGRYVLVGGDISDIDRVANPATFLNGERPPGLKVHADMLSQILDGRTEIRIPNWFLALTALAAVAGGVLTGVLSSRRGWDQAFLATQVLIVMIGPLVLQALGFDTWRVPQFGWVVGWLAAYTATAAAARSVGAEQRAYAQSALGKYLPRDVAAQILRDPSQMALHGERREIYALFTDLQGFTELTHGLEPEMVANLLNAYLDLLSQAVLEHGGTIDKFVGDAVVAFWGAPIARPDDGERAARAAIAMWRVGEAFRTTPMGDHPPLGRTRVGLHRGDAIVGNFGGEGRITYTALGDVMNTASRLESANKTLNTRILVSREAIPPSMAGSFRVMGRIGLRGRSTPVEIFEAALDFPSEARERLNAAYARFDAGEVAALDEIAALSAEFPDDVALRGLVTRLEGVGPGGVFRLG